MLNPIQKKRYQKRFSTVESSFRIEGMDPSGDELYEKAKASILAGEMTPKQALTYVVDKGAARSHKEGVNIRRNPQTGEIILSENPPEKPLEEIFAMIDAARGAEELFLDRDTTPPTERDWMESSAT